MLLYLTTADISNIQRIYTAKSLRDISIERTVVETDGLYGKAFYTTGFMPRQWSIKAYADFSTQDLADYILEHTIDSDARVSKVVTEHFWDF